MNCKKRVTDFWLIIALDFSYLQKVNPTYEEVPLFPHPPICHLPHWD